MIKRRLHQILLLGSILLIVALGFSSSATQRINLIIYDSLINLNTPALASDVVIVAIDERSIASLGRWPWTRSHHAQLIDRLTEYKAKVIGFDVLFTEEESVLSDTEFADAIARHGRVILPVAPEKNDQNASLIELLPLPQLAMHSSAIGHVDTELDIDGISRKIYLFAGLGDARWPALGYALYKEFNDNQIQERQPEQAQTLSTQGTGWIRSTPFLIPYFGKAGTFPRLSYIDVLDGEIDAESITDKVVLIGATATGVGDALSTPVSSNHQRMPGVEINANITAALIQDENLTQVSSLAQAIITLVLLSTLIPIARYLPRRYYPLCLPFAILLNIGLCITLFEELRLWFPPTEALLLQFLGFALLSWRRYNASQSQIQRLNKEVYQRLNFDPLTHLPNRVMLKEQLKLATENASREQRTGLMIIQISGIKEVNNLLGISAGDKALTMAANQIQTAVDFQFPVARLEGLEFAVLLEDQNDDETINHIGRRLLQLLQLPCELDGEHFFFQPSIGVAIFPEDASDDESFLSNAHTAMHQAKSSHKRGLCFFAPQFKEQIIDESSLINDLHQALSQHQLEIYYQPQVISKTGQVIGLEALLRWHHPKRGMVSPAEFIPVAEKTGLIESIGEWVLETACFQIAQWNRDHNQNIRIAVNLSSLQVANPDLVATIESTLERARLAPELLELELTESILIEDFEATIKILQQLKDLGVKIAVDDFGTGYSSLSYLKQFPIDRIKIDQSFVRDIDQSSKSAEITQAIIAMAHSLNMQVIAEGVETDHQRGFLMSQTCEELQGFFFSKPLPSAKIEQLIQKSQFITPNNSSQSHD